MNMEQLKLVEIHWLDSMGAIGWGNPKDQRDTSMIQRSFGWLVDETSESYTVSASIGDGHDDAYAPLKIPKVAVTGFWTIII